VHFLLRKVAAEKDVTGLKIGTIHAWCFEFLLENSSYYNFEPLEEDIQSMQRTAMQLLVGGRRRGPPVSLVL
jgi:hypothetical protein